MSAADHANSSTVGDENNVIERKTTRRIIENGIFGLDSLILLGMLFSLLNTGREKSQKSKTFACFQIAVDYLQLLVFLFNTTFPWGEETAKIIAEYASYVQLQNPLSLFSYQIYLVGFALLTLVLLFCTGVCIFVGYNFRHNKFPAVWPIKLTRLVIRIILSSFYISSFNVFLTAVDCTVIGESKPFLDSFTDIACFEMPHVAIVSVSVLMSMLLTIMAFFTVLVEFEPSPTTSDLTACPESKAEMQMWFLKTVITIVSVVLTKHLEVQGVVYAGTSMLLFLSVARNLPYYNRWTNRVKGAFYFSLVWSSSCLLAVLFVNRDFQLGDLMTFILAAGLVPSGMVGAGIIMLCERRYDGRRLFRNTPLRQPKAGELNERPADNAHAEELQFKESENLIPNAASVERMTRFLRRDPKNEDLRKMANAIYDEGLKRFKDNAGLHLAYAHFNVSFLERTEAGLYHLDKAKASAPNFLHRFDIFCLERERIQRMQANAHGSGAMDLVSYIDFQNRYSQAIENHRKAIATIRKLWKLLVRDTVSINLIARSFNEIDQAERRAEQAYHALLERYTNSARVMRSYGLFMMHVKNNYSKARHMFEEADRLEEAAGDDGDDGNGFSNLDDRKDAIVVINGLGIIQYVNSKVLSLFGYRKKEELIGKNVRIIMCSPYAENHDRYLQKYFESGKATILGQSRKFEAKHKKGFSFRVELCVQAAEAGASDSRADTKFVGILREVDEDEDYGRIQIDSTGIVLKVNQTASDIFGYTSEEMVGKNVKMLMHAKLAKRHDGFLSRFLKNTKSKKGQGVSGRRLVGRHKDGSDVSVSISVNVINDGKKKIYDGTIVSLENEVGIITADAVGRIISVNQTAALMFGYSEDMMAGLEITELLPPYYAAFHARYMSQYKETRKGKIVNTNKERVVIAKHRDGSNFQILLRLNSVQGEGETALRYNASLSLYHKSSDPRFVSATVDNMGRLQDLDGGAWSDIFGRSKEFMDGESLTSYCSWMTLMASLARDGTKKELKEWVTVKRKEPGVPTQLIRTIFVIKDNGESKLLVTIHAIGEYECLLFVTQGGLIHHISEGAEIVLCRESTALVGKPLQNVLLIKDLPATSDDIADQTNLHHFEDGEYASGVTHPLVPQKSTSSLNGGTLMGSTAQKGHDIKIIDIIGKRVDASLLLPNGAEEYTKIEVSFADRHAQSDRDGDTSSTHGHSTYGQSNETERPDSNLVVVRVVLKGNAEKSVVQDDVLDDALSAVSRDMGAWLDQSANMVNLSNERNVKANFAQPLEASSLLGRPLDRISEIPIAEEDEGSEGESRSKDDTGASNDRKKQLQAMKDTGSFAVSERSVAVSEQPSEYQTSTLDNSSVDDGSDSMASEVVKQKRKIVKLQRLLQSKTMEKIVDNFKSYAKLTLFGIFLVNLIAFLAFEVLHGGELHRVDMISDAADVAVEVAAVHGLALELRTSLYLLETSVSDRAGLQYGFTLRAPSVIQRDLRTTAETCLATAKSVVLDNVESSLSVRTSATVDGFQVYFSPFLSYMVDQSQPIERNYTAWEIILEYCTRARHVALLGNASLSLKSLETDSHWRTVMMNFWSPGYGAVATLLEDELSVIDAFRNTRITVRSIFILVELAYLFFSLYMLARRYMQRIVEERVRLYQMFVKIPAKCMLVMLERKDKVGDESEGNASSSSDGRKKDKSDNDDLHVEEATQNSHHQDNKSLKTKKGKQIVARSERTLTGISHVRSKRYVLPIAFWGVFLFVTTLMFGISMQTSNQYYRTVVIAGQRSLSAEAIRSLSLEISSYQTWWKVGLSPRGKNLNELQRHLQTEIEAFESIHKRLVHPMESNALGIEEAESNSAVSSLLSPYQRNLLIQPQCLRVQHNSCLSESHPYFSEVNLGLDLLVKEYSLKARSIAETASLAPRNLSLAATAFGFVWEIGPEDLRAGLNTSKEGILTVDYAYLNTETVLEGVLLAVLVLSLFVYYWRLLRPFLKKTESETHRAAAMIVFLPEIPEMQAFLTRMKKIQSSNANRGQHVKIKRAIQRIFCCGKGRSKVTPLDNSSGRHASTCCWPCHRRKRPQDAQTSNAQRSNDDNIADPNAESSLWKRRHSVAVPQNSSSLQPFSEQSIRTKSSLRKYGADDAAISHLAYNPMFAVKENVGGTAGKKDGKGRVSFVGENDELCNNGDNTSKESTESGKVSGGSTHLASPRAVEHVAAEDRERSVHEMQSFGHDIRYISNISNEENDGFALEKELRTIDEKEQLPDEFRDE